ncbi:hypothetical protein D3C81_1346570 [compost metagenome]
MPLDVAAPWLAADATATEVAAPPLRFSVIGLALLPYATVALTLPATGAPAATVPEYAREPEYGPAPVLLSVAVTVKLYAPAAVGVPDKVPSGARFKPAGTLPAVTA